MENLQALDVTDFAEANFDRLELSTHTLYDAKLVIKLQFLITSIIVQ